MPGFKGFGVVQEIFFRCQVEANWTSDRSFQYSSKPAVPKEQRRLQVNPISLTCFYRCLGVGS